MRELQKLVVSVTSQLYLSAFIKCVLLSVSCYFFTSEISLVPVLASLAGFGLGAVRTGLFRNKKEPAISLIHQYVASTEYSLHLIQKEKRSVADELQLLRLESGFDKTSFPHLKVYSGFWPYIGVFLVSMLFYLFYSGISLDSSGDNPARKSQKSSGKLSQTTAPVFESASVKVKPPNYTKLPETQSKDLNVSTISGSAISWEIVFNHTNELSVRLVNSRGEEVQFAQKNRYFVYSDRLKGSGLYSIKAYWRDSVVYQSDYYRLEAIPDAAPKIEPLSKALYKYHFLRDEKTLKISAKISDDFRVRQAFIVATVARGSGENVKFRELKFPLLPTDFKEADLHKSIDLSALNFTPGDELYYYWAAIDNKQPEPNFSKSDTYFLVYKDTAQIEEAELATMAVNIMPEYFRSQRQIIIDTEKLIAKRKKLVKKEFTSISNEIGFDQKVLRMRYGQYLGEEFETNIGGAGGPPAGETDGRSGNILDAFTHKSDGGNEGSESRSAEPAHETHDHEGTAAEKGSEDPLAALMEQYVHTHDDAETNTFYEQSTRSLLKMALEQMWQSELHLRMYEPEKALPYEHKALEFLKSAQHKARTFAKKSGYDPPPIKEKEKRLTGEMKDVNTSLKYSKVFDEKRTELLFAEMLGYLESSKLSEVQKKNMRETGAALSGRLADGGPLNGGFQNWKVIGLLQKIASGKLLTAQEKEGLKKELFKGVNPTEQSRGNYASEKKLETAFRKRLK